MFRIGLKVFQQQFVFMIGDAMMVADLGRIDGEELALIRQPEILESLRPDGANQTRGKIVSLVLAWVDVKICSDDGQYLLVGAP